MDTVDVVLGALGFACVALVVAGVLVLRAAWPRAGAPHASARWTASVGARVVVGIALCVVGACFGLSLLALVLHSPPPT